MHMHIHISYTNMQVITHSIKIIQYIRQLYVDRPVKYIYKTVISKYHLSSHSLSIETGRLYNIERNVEF